MIKPKLHCARPIIYHRKPPWCHFPGPIYTHFKLIRDRGFGIDVIYIPGDFLLTEDGNYLMTEALTFLILEYGSPVPPPITYYLSWNLPSDPDVVNIRIRALLAPDTPDYTTPYDDVGLVNHCVIPLPHMPPLIGPINYAITSVDDEGVESAILTGQVSYPIIDSGVGTDAVSVSKA